MNPEELLDAARMLIRENRPGTEGVWARGCAILARQALEQAMLVRISTRMHRPDELRFSTQLLCLHDFTDADTARRAAFVWSALSAATHHHGYELAPSAYDLAAWLDTVRDVLTRLRPGGTPGP